MIVTISASYAAGGSEIGPRVADRLGVPFVDRAVPVAVAADLGITVEEAEAVEQDSSSRLWQAFATLSPLSGLDQPFSRGAASESELVTATENQLRRVADEGDAVVLGHAAALVLHDAPDALHVRLDGDPAGRERAAMRQHGIAAAEAAAQRRTNDKVRSGYVRHFYRADSAAPEHYHLLMDTVRLDWEQVEEVLVHAAQALRRR